MAGFSCRRAVLTLLFLGMFTAGCGKGADGQQAGAEISSGQEDAGAAASGPVEIAIFEPGDQEENGGYDSDFFATVQVENASSVFTQSNGDLWACAWSDDDMLYLANGDGRGFDLSGEFSDIVMNRITAGFPGREDLTGERLSSGDAIGQVWNHGYNRKPTGMLSVDGTLYMAVQDLNAVQGPYLFNDARSATILCSADKGVSWTWNKEKPMFDDHIFTTVMFLDYGKDSEFAKDGYVYAYGLDYNWRDDYTSDRDPDSLYLARVEKEFIMDRERWEFFSGFEGDTPLWSAEITDKKPVLTDKRRLYRSHAGNGPSIPSGISVISQGSIVYNQPLDRYIYTSWSEYTYEFYEASAPWGPWKHFYSKDFGRYPWSNTNHGGYGGVVPSKYISGDGKTMWLADCTFSGVKDNYRFALRKIVLEPAKPSSASNQKSAENNLALAGNAPGVTPFVKCASQGKLSVLNDGERNGSESSFDGEKDDADFWGYLYPREYHFNNIRYYFGGRAKTGGSFDSIQVQVRRKFHWESVSGLRIDPICSETDPEELIGYELSFSEESGDGIRVIGEPGGENKYTTITELEVRYQ